MSDDATDEKSETEPTAMTGPVREAQPHGGSLIRGNPPQPRNPTAADNAARANRDIYRLMPSITRIAANRQDPRSNPKSKSKKAAARRGKYSVNQRLAAFGKLLDAARMDRPMREGRVATALSATRQAIYEFFGDDRARAEALMATIAPHWLDF